MPASVRRSLYLIETYCEPLSLWWIMASSRPGWRAYSAWLLGIQNESRAHRLADAPANDPAREDLNHESGIDEALPGRDIREIAAPQLILALGMELPVYPVQRAGNGFVADAGSHHLAPYNATQTVPAHQALHGAARDFDLLLAHLTPDLFGTIGLKVGLPHAMDVASQQHVASRTRTAQRWIAALRSMTAVVRRSDLLHSANRLGSVHQPMLVDKGHHFLKRRRAPPGRKKPSPDAKSRSPCEVL